MNGKSGVLGEGKSKEEFGILKIKKLKNEKIKGKNLQVGEKNKNLEWEKKEKEVEEKLEKFENLGKRKM